MFDIGRPDEVRDAVRWRCHLINAGESLCGVSVGPMVCPMVHWMGGRSVPCLRAMTGGELLCACDQEPRATRRIAYLPLISKDGERVVTVLSNSVALKLNGLPHRSPVLITRSRTPCAPLSVQHLKGFDVGSRAISLADKMHPQDIRDYLLHLWSLDVLTRWCIARSALNAAAATLAGLKEAARDTIEVPPPATTSGATVLRDRLRRGRKVTS